MTDKEVIIDDINVAGCEYHSSTPTSELCYMKGNKCKHNPNCYYKQLQRKEQECEKLKIQLMHKDEVNMFFNTPIEGWSNDPCEICQYKQEYKHLQAENEKLKNNLAIANSNHEAAEKENDSYMRALEEIKGLSQSINDDFESDDIEQQLHYVKEIAEQINNKIHEVLKDAD